MDVYLIMTSLPSSSHQAALTVMQQAVAHLAQWSGVSLSCPEDSPTIKVAKEYLSWTENGEPSFLRLLFDCVKLSVVYYK